MKYYYKKPTECVPTYGRVVTAHGEVYRHYTLYFKDGIGLGVIQQKFDTENLCCWWDCIDPWLANDIYLNPNFEDYFEQHATADIPILRVRQVMWALRMKPLPKEFWEPYF